MRMNAQERCDYSAPRFDDFHGLRNNRIAAYNARLAAQRAQRIARFDTSRYFAGVVSDDADQMRAIDALEATL